MTQVGKTPLGVTQTVGRCGHVPSAAGRNLHKRIVARMPQEARSARKHGRTPLALTQKSSLPSGKVTKRVTKFMSAFIPKTDCVADIRSVPSAPFAKEGDSRVDSG